jgi:hypothetical protein
VVKGVAEPQCGRKWEPPPRPTPLPQRHDPPESSLALASYYASVSQALTPPPILSQHPQAILRRGPAPWLRGCFLGKDTAPSASYCLTIQWACSRCVLLSLLSPLCVYVLAVCLFLHRIHAVASIVYDVTICRPANLLSLSFLPLPPPHPRWATPSSGKMHCPTCNTCGNTASSNSSPPTRRCRPLLNLN